MFRMEKWWQFSGWAVILALAPAMLLFLTGEADAESFTALPESRVQLNGSATLRRWRCENRQVSGFVEVGLSLQDIHRLETALLNGADLTAPNLDLPVSSPPRARITVPVRSLICGNDAMERDMYGALKAEQFPTIEYEFSHVESVAVLQEAGAIRFKIQTEGILEIAGSRQVVRMDVTIERQGEDTFKIFGKKRVKMTDFGITPPSAFWGLIRAHDPVDVIFDLLVGTHPR